MRYITHPFVILVQLCIAICTCDSIDPAMSHISTESEKMEQFFDKQPSSTKNFVEDQIAKMKEFIQAQKVKVENALNTGYEGATKMQLSVNNYVEKQQKFISDEVNNYVEGVIESNNIAVDKTPFVRDVFTSSLLDYPELVLSVPAIVAKNGYVCETHTVISEGYLLNVHRIPRPKDGHYVSSKTVLLQHGLFASSADWILNGPEKGLAYVLADAGYDVWMTNIRGNKYSREHARLKTNSREYWNFSWHEVALYDLPAIIDYIIDIKGPSTDITYIGHSMGTSILFAMLTVRPEYNNILSAAFALAPVAFMSHIKSPLKALAPIASNVAYMEMLYGSHEFLPKDSALGRLYTSCHISSNDFGVCKNVIFYICGHDEKQFNNTLLPVFLSNLGTGTSWKTAVHFAQEIVSNGRFQQFDYGSNKNVEVYGTTQPPEYDLSKITLPITLFWSQNDLLSSEKDVRRLYESLPPSTQMYKIPFADFNHLDYLWAVDANNLLNDKILDLLSKVNRKGFGFKFDFGK